MEGRTLAEWSMAQATDVPSQATNPDWWIIFTAAITALTLVLWWGTIGRLFEPQPAPRNPLCQHCTELEQSPLSTPDSWSSSDGWSSESDG